MEGLNSTKFWKTAFLAAIAACGMAATAIRCDAQITYPVHNEPAMTQDHYDAANLIMGANPDLQGWRSLCINLKDWGTFRQDLAKSQKTLDPIKAFDNLYYMGFSSVGSWALVTSAGIIQIDTLHNADEAEKIIVADYKKAGLDPNQIKYVILTHSHAEHYGGGKYFQDSFHAHILMGGPDWDIIEKTPNPPPAKRDMVVTDGQKLTLGDTTITMYVMPGHTPGTLNMIFPVMDHGARHMVSFTGGTGIPHGIEALTDYKASMRRFAKLGQDAGVDAIVSNHPWFDDTYVDGKTDKAARALSRKPGDPNPWVIGPGEYMLTMMADLECTETSIARLKETGTQ
jgi:metallo-beta-lactamase class B